MGQVWLPMPITLAACTIHVRHKATRAPFGLQPQVPSQISVTLFMQVVKLETPNNSVQSNGVKQEPGVKFEVKPEIKADAQKPFLYATKVRLPSSCCVSSALPQCAKHYSMMGMQRSLCPA